MTTTTLRIGDRVRRIATGIGDTATVYRVLRVRDGRCLIRRIADYDAGPAFWISTDMIERVTG